MFFSIIFAEKFNFMVMEIIANSSEVRSTLHGITSVCRDGIKLTFSVLFLVGKRYDGEITFSGLSDLVDYLLHDCGFDSVTFKTK